METDGCVRTGSVALKEFSSVITTGRVAWRETQADYAASAQGSGSARRHYERVGATWPVATNHRMRISSATFRRHEVSPGIRCSGRTTLTPLSASSRNRAMHHSEWPSSVAVIPLVERFIAATLGARPSSSDGLRD